jgi:hypothetical protein
VVFLLLFFNACEIRVILQSQQSVVRRAAVTALESILQTATAAVGAEAAERRAAGLLVQAFVATWDAPTAIKTSGSDATIREFGARLATQAALLLAAK